jgi:hypothetical protein
MYARRANCVCDIRACIIKPKAPASLWLEINGPIAFSMGASTGFTGTAI